MQGTHGWFRRRTGARCIGIHLRHSHSLFLVPATAGGLASRRRRQVAALDSLAAGRPLSN
ncbi:hypothetical protein AZ22_0131 [Bordetella bronchiseptica 980-2]|nr:hypothetical protein AZ22_0131 [Bordetella bronchiseptica 980-2]